MPKDGTTTRRGRGTKAKAKETTTTRRGAAKQNKGKLPKRGLSAYMFFANDMREKIRKENPGMPFGEVGKELGERWKSLDEKGRTPYDAKAAADKKRYEEEKEAMLQAQQRQAEEEEEDEDNADD